MVTAYDIFSFDREFSHYTACGTGYACDKTIYNDG